jgi:hypothetical protein
VISQRRTAATVIVLGLLIGAIAGPAIIAGGMWVIAVWAAVAGVL